MAFRPQMGNLNGIALSMLAANVVDCGLEPRFGQSKDWLARPNQDNVSEWSDMSIRGLVLVS